MKEFEFTLKFSLPDSTQDPQDYIDALGESGCDDAIIGIAQKGRVALQFTREASDAFSAVTSAIEDVKSAIPDAKLIESTPDLVGLTDIAKLMGVTRQYLRKLETTKINFPQPVHSGKVAIWHLSNFLQWYEVSQRKQVNITIKEIASANMQINIAKEWAQLDHSTKSKISSLVL
ncbi:DNA-binding protein [Aliidiomarina sp.]|uniref:DNA-binding protein n=1 Tax=Aliidiomarina sp. TaxID=1872439 RepID=UPI003A4D45D4